MPSPGMPPSREPSKDAEPVARSRLDAPLREAALRLCSQLILSETEALHPTEAALPERELDHIVQDTRAPRRPGMSIAK